MYLVELRATGFRNLATETFSFDPHGNLVMGANGEGKTNLLEAVTVLGNLRSFRAVSVRQAVTHGEHEFLLEGRVESAHGSVRLSQHVTPGPPVRRQLTVSGATASVAQYLRVFPIVALTGADRDLVVGEPRGRRAFLDRMTFLLKGEYIDEIRTYQKILQQRNAALVNAVTNGEMEIWEHRLAASAAIVVERRQVACQRLVEAFLPVYDAMRGAQFPDLDLGYRGEPELEQAENRAKVEEYYRKRYNETRTRDRRTGFTGEGPHRHDLVLRANSRAVRYTLSSGQVKVVAAALRLASLQQVERERGELIPVIIDDVDAELDAATLARLIAFVDDERQLFLSSADAEVLGKLATGSSRFEIRRGAVLREAGERR